MTEFADAVQKAKLSYHIDKIMVERAQWKEAYITAYLSATGYKITDLELIEEQVFDNALNRIVINYYLQKKL